MRRVDRDVIVAGAGPAGIGTAVAAVRSDPSLRGRILVLDRARFPRSKPCGGGLTGHIDEALLHLGLALTVPSFASPRAIVRYGDYRREVTLEKPVRTVRREAFDASLVDQARAMGIEVREGSGVTGFRVEGEGVAVETKEGPLYARILVGADGAGSVVRKSFEGRAASQEARDQREGGGGLEAPRARPIRLFRAELPDRGWHREEMLYDFTPMLDGVRGYLWIFPVPGGLLNVGIMHDPSLPHTGAELVALLGSHWRVHGISLAGAQLRGWPAWGYRPSQKVSAPHLLTVGDAAGIDGLTGEGIAVALEQGLIAGRAIASALSSGSFGFRGYRFALARANVGRELALDGMLARMLYGGHDYRRWLSLVLYDDEMLGMYAARVSGSMVLSNHPLALGRALVRHLMYGRSRMRSLRAVEPRAA